MKLGALCCLVCLASSSLNAQEEWRQKNREIEIEQVGLWETKLEESSGMEGSAKLDFLTIGLRNMAHRKTLSDHGQEVDELYIRIQMAMLAVPGHAEYYRDRILNARLEYEQTKGKGEEGIGFEANARTALRNIQTEGFRTMAYLPSVETVRVLGEFLSDERGYTKLPPDPTMDDIEAAGIEFPNCRGASEALVCLPFVSKPQDKNWMTMTYEDVAPWREWYEQIKAGNRTFRFEGDPTEYDLNGPASKQTLDRIARAGKRDAERADGKRRGAEADAGKKEGKSGGILWSLLAFLLVAAMWYGWRKKAAA